MSYYWSTDEESYSSGPYDTRDEAIEDANDCGNEVFWTCERVEPTPEMFPLCADAILESVGDQVYDAVGDASDRWLEYITPCEQAGLQAGLQSVLSKWLEVNAPFTFWVARHVEKHAGTITDVGK